VSERDVDTRSDAVGLAHPRLDELVGYRGGDLGPARAASFEQHLAACESCRQRLDAAEAVLAQIDLIAERPPTADSLEVELLIERVAQEHNARWQRAHPREPAPVRQPASTRVGVPMIAIALAMAAAALIHLGFAK
jgi:anti-sigma factor ChrR (cupin superfamily)